MCRRFPERRKEGKKESRPDRRCTFAGMRRITEREGGVEQRVEGGVLKNLEPPLEIRRSAATNRTEPSSSVSPKSGVIPSEFLRHHRSTPAS